MPDQLISIVAAKCAAGDSFTFDNLQAAVAFVRMLAGDLAPRLFVDLITALYHTPEAATMAQQIVASCMGAPL